MICDIDKTSYIKNYFKSQMEKGNLVNWSEILIEIEKGESDIALKESLKKWYDNITSFSFLVELPEETEELFFHSSDCSYLKTADSTSPFYHDFTHEDINLLLNHLALSQNQSWNLKDPYVSFYFDCGIKNFRVTLIHPSLNPEGSPKAFFRQIKKKPISLDKYQHSLLLKKLISDKKNIVICGSTGCGKTSLINSLISEIKPHEHTIILEDTFELTSPNDRTTRMLSLNHVDLDQLLTYSLRMSPDRIVLGEIRSHEILTFTLALNTGHKGLLTSLHANNAKDALMRLALLYATYTRSQLDFNIILKLICQNIDCVIYLDDKRIDQIIEVYGSEQNNIFFDSLI